MFASLAFAAGLAGVAAPSPPVGAAAPRDAALTTVSGRDHPCRVGQLVATPGVSPASAAVTNAAVIVFRNVSARACTLHGYAHVVAMAARGTPRAVARDERDGYLGGWMGFRRGVALPPPTVTLRARGGEASEMVQVTGGIGCPVIAVLWVTIPGGREAVRVAAQMMACLRFGASVNPIVPGATGSAR